MKLASSCRFVFLLRYFMDTVLLAVLSAAHAATYNGADAEFRARTLADA